MEELTSVVFLSVCKHLFWWNAHSCSKGVECIWVYWGFYILLWIE